MEFGRNTVKLDYIFPHKIGVFKWMNLETKRVCLVLGVSPVKVVSIYPIPEISRYDRQQIPKLHAVERAMFMK